MAEDLLSTSPKLIDKEIAFYQREGYLLIPGLIPTDVAAHLRDEVLHIYQQLGIPFERLCKTLNFGDKLSQSGQYLEGSLLDQFVNSPRLREIAGQLMGGPSSIYFPFTAVKNGGGGGRFHFHQDNQYTKFEGPGINLWTAFETMSPENGGLEIVPRSHLRGTLDSVVSGDGDGHRKVPYEPNDFLPIRMHPGDCVAFTRLTLHGSGTNNTDRPRIAYAVQFHRDDTKATWDDKLQLLKGADRWNTRPVKQIVAPPKPESRDGH